MLSAYTFDEKLITQRCRPFNAADKVNAYNSKVPRTLSTNCNVRREIGSYGISRRDMMAGVAAFGLMPSSSVFAEQHNPSLTSGNPLLTRQGVADPLIRMYGGGGVYVVYTRLRRRTHTTYGPATGPTAAAKLNLFSSKESLLLTVRGRDLKSRTLQMRSMSMRPA